MIQTIKNFMYYPLFAGGYALFNLTKKTPYISYVSLRKLFCLTNGKSNEFVSDIIRKSHPFTKIPTAQGVLGNLGEKEMNEIVSGIERDGFYIFKNKLSKELCDELIKFAETTPAKLVPNKSNLPDQVYDRSKILAPRYQFQEQNILKLGAVQKMLTDDSILAVAQNYLKSVPVNDQVTMWWSTVFQKEASSAAAQLYHFDMDRLKFLKFFVYLTDVDTNNGPHCYIRKSHVERPKPLRKDTRIDDTEILSHYPKEDEIEICGQRGTLLAVDTSGFHKGKPLVSGERLIFQIEFTNSLFGTVYNNIKLDESFTPEFKEKASKYKHTFQRFNV